jgi:hypothetical protein
MQHFIISLGSFEFITAVITTKQLDKEVQTMGHTFQRPSQNPLYYLVQLM